MGVVVLVAVWTRVKVYPHRFSQHTINLPAQFLFVAVFHALGISKKY
jgi:hypothetical protein